MKNAVLNPLTLLVLAHVVLAHVVLAAVFALLGWSE